MQTPHHNEMHHQMVNMKSLEHKTLAPGDDSINISISNTSSGNGRGEARRLQSNSTLNIDEYDDVDIEDAEDDTYESEMAMEGEDDCIMDRWQWNETYTENQKDDSEFLSILNPSNNSFAYVTYQRWLNVKKLELENDSLVLNLSKYWLTSYFTLIIILIFVIPNSVHLYFAFVLTLFIMYYCYLRTIKNVPHPQALKKVLYLFCSFVTGTNIIFTTEQPPTNSGNNNTNNNYKQLTQMVIQIIMQIVQV